jgi:hypothetical protein
MAPLRNNIQRFLKKTGSAAGAIDAHSTATGKLSDWTDRTTPTVRSRSASRKQSAIFGG